MQIQVNKKQVHCNNESLTIQKHSLSHILHRILPLISTVSIKTLQTVVVSILTLAESIWQNSFANDNNRGKNKIHNFIKL